MKVAIIGGYGKMGRRLAAYLKKEGYEVLISGPDRKKLARSATELHVRAAPAGQAVKESDVIILSVPIDSFETAVKEIAPHTHAGQLIFDVTSIKAKPVAIMHKYVKNGTVLGVHPMFGPGATGIAGRRFVLTPVGAKEKMLAKKVGRYLEARGAKVVMMKPEEHDEIMSIVLGLSHFIALVSADTLLSLGKIKTSGPVSGTTYTMLLKMAEAVVSEDPDFYSSLQIYLPGLVKIQKLFQQKAGEWASLVKKGKKEEFMDKMSRLRGALKKEDPQFASAYEEMYRLIGQ